MKKGLSINSFFTKEKNQYFLFYRLSKIIGLKMDFKNELIVTKIVIILKFLNLYLVET